MSHKREDFVDLGITPLGIPIHVSRRYLETPITIAVGNIIPHMYAGWAGGAKMVQPGVTSAVTTGRTHLIAGPRVYEILGNVDNEVRKEMETIAVKSGLKFIVNVVLDAGGVVAGVVAGDVVKAHRAGVEIARPIYTLELSERPDIVVASSHPADRDLWQGFKPVNNCGMLVKDGGTLILIIPAPEGIAPDHTLLVDLGTTPGDEVRPWWIRERSMTKLRRLLIWHSIRPGNGFTSRSSPMEFRIRKRARSASRPRPISMLH